VLVKLNQESVSFSGRDIDVIFVNKLFSAKRVFSCLSFENCTLEISAVEVIADAVEKNNLSSRLTLKDCKVPTAGIKAICRALKKNPLLDQLNLSGSHLEAEVVTDIVAMVESNTTLLDVRLENCLKDTASAVNAFYTINERLQQNIQIAKQRALSAEVYTLTALEGEGMSFMPANDPAIETEYFSSTNDLLVGDSGLDEEWPLNS